MDQGFEYDRAGRLVREAQGGGHKAFGYDLAGNRVSEAQLAGVREESTLSFAAGWADVADGNASGGGYKRTTTVGADATLAFEGAAVSVLSATGPTGGVLRAWLDPDTANERWLGDVDQCAPAEARQVARTFAGLGQGVHTPRLTYVGAGACGAATQGATLDAVLVYGEIATSDFDPDNRLSWTTRAGGVTDSYAYDANGALLQATTGGVATDYAWDAAGRLARVQAGGGTPTTFAYDGDGVRVSKTTGSTTTRYVNSTTSLSSVLQEVVEGAGGKTVSRVPGIAEFDSSRAAPDDWAYVHADAQNNRALTNSYAQVRKWWDFDPWGLTRYEDGPQDSSFDYAGEQRDTETGLIFLRSRYYQPGLGRFISRDSWGGADFNPQSWNRYSYAENDPINHVDPDGHKKKKIKWANGADPDDDDRKRKRAKACKNPGQYTGSCNGGPPNKAYTINEWDEANIRGNSSGSHAGGLER